MNAGGDIHQAQRVYGESPIFTRPAGYSRVIGSRFHRRAHQVHHSRLFSPPALLHPPELLRAHFLCTTGQEPRNLDPIPQGYTGPVTYRIAYIAFRLEDSHRGRTLRQSLSRISAIDPGYIQFGSADWFWERCVNSYALQARPATHMLEDQFVLDCMEALNTQRAGNRLFHELRLLLAVETGELLTR